MMHRYITILMTEITINRVVSIVGFTLLFILIMANNRSFQKLKKKFGKGEIGEYERINQIVHSAPFALNTYLLLNSDNKIVNCSAKAQKMFGWKEIDLIGRGINIIICERDFERFETFKKTRLLSSDDEVIEIEGVTKLATPIPLEIAVGKWNDDNSNWYFTVVMRDISHRKKNEETQRLLMNEVLENKMIYHDGEKVGSVGFWRLDCRTGKMEGSPNFYHLFGIKSTEFPPETLIKRVALEDRTMVAEAMATAKENKTGYSIQYRFNGMDGYVSTFHSTTSAVKNGRGEMTHLIGMSRLIKKEHPTWL